MCLKEFYKNPIARLLGVVLIAILLFVIGYVGLGFLYGRNEFEVNYVAGIIGGVVSGGILLIYEQFVLPAIKKGE